MATPNLNLPELPQGASPADVSIAFNEAMQIMDALSPLVVQSRALTAPPTTLAGDVGKRWIPATGATGAWAGHAGKVALCTAADVWKIIVPPMYQYARDLNTSTDVRQTALGTWT